MKLSELFRSTNTSRTDENGESVVISQKNLNTLKLNRQIKALVPGQTIHGEVVSKNGGEVQIKLADDMVLSARLERDMLIDIGKIMSFEVRNNGKSLILSPLFANTATDANVIKALNMANLPVNESSVEMTQTMMEQGMSIDKTSIQNVYRDVNANRDAAVRDIVQLHQLNIEVTPENLNQLQSYKAMQHQLTGAMSQIAEELTMQMEVFLNSENPQDAILLFSKLSAVFSAEIEIAGESQTAPASVQHKQAVVWNGNPETLVDPKTVDSENKQSLNMLLKPEELQVFKETLIQLDPKGASAKIQNLVARIDAGTATTADIRENVSVKDFANLLKNQMMANWLLEPEHIQEKENVEKVYQRISKQLGEMQKVISQMPGMEQSTAVKSVTNMQHNLDFINQLNQAFTYVQLPLQMGGKETNGELYVYTNKKNLAREDGSVSAFLHLDMENLGPVDVYVAMQNQKVNTKFYLKDDEMIDFIQTHIHILNERLAKRGYSMNCEMLVKEQAEQDKSILERLTESEKNVTVLSRYAFDVRA